MINMKENTCNVCHQHFPSTESRNDHVKNIQAFLLLYCKVCGFIGSVRDSYNHHDYFLFCMVCKSSVSLQFWDHICLHKKHVQELASRSRSSCGTCRKELFCELDVANHARECREGNEDFSVCKCCLKSFPDEIFLKFHLTCFKPDKSNMLLNHCASCNKDYDKEDIYKDHIVQIHLKSIAIPKFDKLKGPKKKRPKSRSHPKSKNTKKIPCRFCKLQFSNKNIATAHERKQHGEEIVECPLCLEKLKLAKMKGHNTTHRTRKCYRNSAVKVCNVCGVSVKNLPRHLTVHRNKRQYKCSICGKSFNLAWDLKKHLITHVGEAKHKCPECGKGFKVAYNLKVHMRIHDSFKPFGCLVCAKTFTTKQSRDIHLKIHDRMTSVK